MQASRISSYSPRCIPVYPVVPLWTRGTHVQANFKCWLTCGSGLELFTPTCIDTGFTLECNWHLKSTRARESCRPREATSETLSGGGRELSDKFNGLLWAFFCVLGTVSSESSVSADSLHVYSWHAKITWPSRCQDYCRKNSLRMPEYLQREIHR